ncbi:MAG: hypothetical protein ACR2RF_01105 [Geminicoccaceae bacterium]
MANEIFDDLSGYEKGVLARALLGELIRQGGSVRDPSDSCPGEISFSIQKWQLELLAHFCKDDGPEEADDDDEILLDKLCQLR